MKGGVDPLAGAKAKLERAELHLQALQAVIKSFFETEPKPYVIVTEVDVESSRVLGRIRIASEPPLHWCTIVGDYLQNLRAVLDHLAWQLVLANGEKPGFGTCFPIFDAEPPDDPSHRDRERWERNICGMSAHAQRFIDACQPYKILNGPDQIGALTGLRTLSNEDKHRTLVPMLTAISGPSKLVRIELLDLVNVKPPSKPVKFHAGRPLENNDLVFQVPIEITGGSPEVKTKGNLPMDIGFGRKPIPLEGLKQMGTAVGLILDGSRRYVGNSAQKP
jgi:hypothetical protein